MRVCIEIVRTEDGRHLARCPMLPGCTATAGSPDQAKENLEEAIRGYLASVHDFVPEALHVTVQ